MSQTKLLADFSSWKVQQQKKLTKLRSQKKIDGREHQKRLKKITNTKFADWKAMKKLGVKVATKEDIPVKTTSNKNIVKANLIDPKIKKAAIDSNNKKISKLKKELKQLDKKSAVVKKKPNEKMYNLKGGGKGTAAQRLAEIDAEKAKEKKAAQSKKLIQMLKTAAASKKPTKVASKNPKGKEKIVLKKGGMTKRGR